MGDFYDTIDAPNCVDFTKEIEPPPEDWFDRRHDENQGFDQKQLDFTQNDDSYREESDFCPSPSKKKRMNTSDTVCGAAAVPRRSPRLKTTEQLELEKIAEKRKELVKARRLNQATYKKAIVKGHDSVMKSTQPATMPRAFNFQSDKRTRGVAETSGETLVRDFTKVLRSASPITTGVKGPTKTKPFNFSSAKSTSNLTTGKYMSTAELIVSYNDRIRSNVPNKDHSSTNERTDPPGLTVPKTPNLSTRGRSRSVNVLTREEEEQQEWQEQQKLQFKANPVKKKVLTTFQPVIPSLSKPSTIPKEFNLHKSNIDRHKVMSEDDESNFQFHAHSFNPKIFKGQSGVKPAEKRPITVPHSPAFALKNRLRSREKLGAPELLAKPHSGVPFRPQLDHKHTVAKPFAVEQHSKEMLDRKAIKVQKVLEEEKKAHEFTASLLPSGSPDELPPRRPRPVTAVEPFHLTVDERGTRYQEEWKSKQIQKEDEDIKAKTRFHALSNKVIFKTPFVPEKSVKPLTEMSSFTLNTDQRAAEREQYNQQVKAHEAGIEALKRRREERKRMEETEAVTQLRQKMVHNATGIKKFKPVEVQPSSKPLTVAESPVFHTTRLRPRTMLE